MLLFPSLLPILVLCFEKGGRKTLWNLSKRCGLGWACMGASVPKNGNKRPLSLLLENFSPTFFLALRSSRLLVSWIMSSAGCYRSKADKGEVKERYAGPMSGVNSRQSFFGHQEAIESHCCPFPVYKSHHAAKRVCIGLEDALSPCCLVHPYHKQARISGETLACDDLHISAPAWPSVI